MKNRKIVIAATVLALVATVIIVYELTKTPEKNLDQYTYVFTTNSTGTWINSTSRSWTISTNDSERIYLGELILTGEHGNYYYHGIYSENTFLVGHFTRNYQGGACNIHVNCKISELFYIEGKIFRLVNITPNYVDIRRMY